MFPFPSEAMKIDVPLLWSNPTQPALQKKTRVQPRLPRELNSGKVAGIVCLFEWTHRSTSALASFNQVEAQKKAAIRVAALRFDF
jgi:hypothetical protein